MKKTFIFAVTGIIFTLLAGSTETQATSRQKQAQIDRALRKFENGGTRVNFIDYVNGLNIPNPEQYLTPPYWTAFLDATNGYNYTELRDTIDGLSNGIRGGFDAQIITNVHAGGRSLEAWAMAWKAAAFVKGLSNTPENTAKLNRFVIAARVHGALRHLNDNNICQNVLNEVETNRTTVTQAYARELGNRQHRGTSISSEIATRVIAHNEELNVATLNARRLVDINHWKNPLRGFTTAESTRIANAVFNETLEQVALATVIGDQDRFEGLNAREAARLILIGDTTIKEVHRVLKTQDLGLRYANIEGIHRTSMVAHIFDGLSEQQALEAVLTPLNRIRYSTVNAVATRMLQGRGMSFDNAFAILEPEAIKGRLRNRTHKLGFLLNGPAEQPLVRACLRAETINDGIHAYCRTLVHGNDAALARALQHRLQYILNPVGFNMDDMNDLVRFVSRAHITRRLREDFFNLGDIHQEIINQLTATPTAEITEVHVLLALRVHDGVTYADQFGANMARELISVRMPTFVDATRTVRINGVADEINRAYGHLPPEECVVLATDFIDEVRVGGVNEANMKLALAAHPSALGFDPEPLLEFQDAVLGGQTIDIASQAGGIALELLRDVELDFLNSSERVDRVIFATTPLLDDNYDFEDEFSFANLDDNHRRLFAKFVNSAKQARENIDNRIIAATQVIKILRDMKVPFLQMEEKHDSILEQLTNCIYPYMKENMAEGHNDYHEGDFMTSLGNLKALLPLSTPSPCLNMNYDTAYNIYKMNSDIEKDRTIFLKRHTDAQDSLKARLRAAPTIPNPDVGQRHLKPRIVNPQCYNMGYGIDIHSETNDMIAAIDRLTVQHRQQAVYLDYAALTYNDHLGQIFNVDYAPITNVKFEHLKQDCINVIERVLPGNAMDIGNRCNNYNQKKKLLKELKEAFDEFASEVGIKDKWREKVNALLTLVPQHEVPLNIIRPGQEGHNPQQWNEELDRAKKLMIEGVVGTIDGCNTGKNRKINLLLHGNQDHLGIFLPKVKIAQFLAKCIQNWKMEDGIEKLGRNAFEGTEGDVSVVQVALQRTRIGLGLGGDFQTTPFVGFGAPGSAENKPLQIIRNLFVPNQPNRIGASKEGYFINRDNVREHGIKRRPDVTFEHLTVKRLVDLVYARFDEGPVADFIEFVKGDLDLELDKMNLSLNFKEGTFFKVLVGNDRKAETYIPSEYYKREMAFYLLVKFGYIKMSDEARDALYVGRQYVSKLEEVGHLDDPMAMDDRSDDILDEDRANVKFAHGAYLDTLPELIDRF